MFDLAEALGNCCREAPLTGEVYSLRRIRRRAKTPAVVYRSLCCQDMLGSQDFIDWYESLDVEHPDWRDFDHLHAHMLQKRDYFLTWDKNIHHFAREFATRWRIEVRKPEDYLADRPRT